jgi:hypothetical protein
VCIFLNLGRKKARGGGLIVGLHLSSHLTSKEQQTFNIHRIFSAEYHLIRPTMFAIVKKASQSSLSSHFVQRRSIAIGTDLSSSSCSFQKARPWVSMKYSSVFDHRKYSFLCIHVSCDEIITDSVACTHIYSTWTTKTRTLRKITLYL